MPSEEFAGDNKQRCPRVFISYSRTDKRLLQELHAHLDHYSFREELENWDDTKILAGSKWREELRKSIRTADVAILLISPEFLASEFIIKNELPPLLQAANQNRTTILCVILRPCAFVDSNLSEFQAVNPPSQPLSGMSRGKRDEVWAKVAKFIKNSFQNMQKEENE